MWSFLLCRWSSSVCVCVEEKEKKREHAREIFGVFFFFKFCNPSLHSPLCSMMYISYFDYVQKQIVNMNFQVYGWIQWNWKNGNEIFEKSLKVKGLASKLVGKGLFCALEKNVCSWSVHILESKRSIVFPSSGWSFIIKFYCRGGGAFIAIRLAAVQTVLLSNMSSNYFIFLGKSCLVGFFFPQSTESVLRFMLFKVSITYPFEQYKTF